LKGGGLRVMKGLGSEKSLGDWGIRGLKGWGLEKHFRVQRKLLLGLNFA